MGSPLQNRPSQTAGPLLATSLVLLLGLAGCLVIQVAGEIRDLRVTAGIVGLFVLYGCFAFLMRDRREASMRDREMWTFRRKPPAEKVVYQLRPQPVAPGEEPATQTPPTVERIRELLEDDSRTWVPARGPSTT
ncbi:MAG: hypothetical protein R3C01_04940 [Planctomycetaceae bacterium]